jgi:hypothetical protein
MRNTPIALALAASLALAGAALAQTPPPLATPPQYYRPPPVVVATPPRPLPTATITFAPILLIAPVFELTAELRAGERVGIAVIGGAGSIKDRETDVKFSVYEAGGQLRYYVLGDFRRGLELGLEALYLHVSGSKGTTTGNGEGLAVGPFIGYKLGTDVGFVFEAQLGIQRAGIAAEAHDSASGTSDSGSTDRWLPLLNLNVGWSF